MIRNLLFDLGGVLMDLDRSRCVRAFGAVHESGRGLDRSGDIPAAVA